MEIIVGEIRSEVLRARVRASEEAIRIIESVKADIIGVGSGSTIKVFIGMLSREFLREKCFISTSYDTTLALSSAGARCIITDMPPEEIDIAVDSADEIDRLGNMLKGGGGALFREKITLLSAIKRIIIADEMKLVDKLGRRGLIPVEIAPYAYNYVRKALMRMSLELVPRTSEGKLGPLITDNGNILADIVIKGSIEDPVRVDSMIRSIEGVITTGIFPYADYEIVVGMLSGEIMRIPKK